MNGTAATSTGMNASATTASRVAAPAAPAAPDSAASEHFTRTKCEATGHNNVDPWHAFHDLVLIL
jgi:hypothetical protein